MKLEEFMEKLRTLKDLRGAIDFMQKNSLEKRDTTQPPSMLPKIKEAGQKAVKETGETPIGSPFKNIKHLGIMTGSKGLKQNVVTHRIGTPGESMPHEYAVDFNLEHEAKGLPAYTVHQVDKKHGQAISHAPTPHKDIKSAVRSVMNHAHYGKWE